jgi:SAM-dependent methyltransferase
MAIDVIDLRSFYASPLGESAQRCLARVLAERWTSCAGLTLLGMGYASPYLGALREKAAQVQVFMPAEQGAEPWPPDGPNVSELVDSCALPLPDSSMDRILVVHALENVSHPRDMLAELWRVLAPSGRLILLAPNRAGVWARFDHTPFGQGEPYSRSQLRGLMRDALFSPIHWGEALYAPPSERRLALRVAPQLERIGRTLSLPGYGLHVVEATKLLYQPVAFRQPARRAMRSWQPALAAPGRVGAPQGSPLSPSLTPD